MNIILYENGPIVISNEHSKLALCRCGLSENKPLCDGSHTDCFEAGGGEVKVKADQLSIETN